MGKLLVAVRRDAVVSLISACTARWKLEVTFLVLIPHSRTTRVLFSLLLLPGERVYSSSAFYSSATCPGNFDSLLVEWMASHCGRRDRCEVLDSRIKVILIDAFNVTCSSNCDLLTANDRLGEQSGKLACLRSRYFIIDKYILCERVLTDVNGNDK